MTKYELYCPDNRISKFATFSKYDLLRHLYLRRISLTDRMLKMMNKYTDQLEVLVEERTLQLAEEKDRADQLLYLMLPR